MYHIPDDGRSRRSAERAYAGLLDCLETSSLDRLTVTELCEAAHVGRATFYRLFDNVTDVLMYRCDVAATRADARLGGIGRDCSQRQRLVMLTEGWMGEGDLLAALVSVDRLDLLQRTFGERRKQICSMLIPERDLDPSIQYLFVTILAALLAASFKTWDDGRRTKSADDLCDELITCMRALSYMMGDSR